MIAENCSLFIIMYEDLLVDTGATCELKPAADPLLHIGVLTSDRLDFLDGYLGGNGLQCL